jgi:hypothetical protein
MHKAVILPSLFGLHIPDILKVYIQKLINSTWGGKTKSVSLIAYANIEKPGVFGKRMWPVYWDWVVPV